MIFILKNKGNEVRYDTLASVKDKEAAVANLDGNIQVHKADDSKFGKITTKGRQMDMHRHLEFQISMIDIYLNIYEEAE